MAIPPTKLGGYGPLDVPRVAEFVEMDELLATRGLDAKGNDTATGTLSLQQSTYQPGTPPTLSGGVNMSGAGSSVYTANGGRLVLGGATEFPVYTTPHNRTVRTSMLEVRRSKEKFDVPTHTTIIAGNVLVIDDVSGGVYNSIKTSGSYIQIPITKPMDGAQLNEVQLFFFMPDGSPSAVLSLAVYRLNPAVSPLVGGGATSLGTPVSGTYTSGGGVIQALIVTGITETIDLSTYTYSAVLTESVSVAKSVIYLAHQERYSTIADERFTQ